MNKRLHNYFLLLFTFVLLTVSVSAQYESRGKEFNYVDAESFFKGGNYYDALPLYEILMAENPKVAEYQLKIGICHLHLTSSPEKAIESIEAVHNKSPKTADVQYYLGKAYALNYKFDLAIETFEKALKNKRTSLKLKKEIPHLVEQCNNAKELIKDSLSVEIINMGKPINSIDNEYSPTINADETTIIFTYKGPKSTGERQDVFNRPEINGNFYEDIYISQRILNTWTEPKSIGDTINSYLHEASISLSPDGQKLFVYRDTPKFSGDIYVSKKENGEWLIPHPLTINTEFWEGHAAISPNGKFMIFSSERPGGIGFRDLYSAIMQEDRTWGEVKNLGPTINTKYNDDAPFIHSDGVTFNFSSEGHTSMGGYDIFESKIVTDSTYLEPRNIGYPINTTSNDIFFYVSGRGNAYYSSARKGGVGQQDIYVINVKDIITSKPVLLVKGIVKTNGKFDVAKITVRTESGKDLGTYYSDLSDGKYQFYVDLDDYYVITYAVDGFPSQVVSIDATEYTEYTEIEKNINFFSRDVNISGVALLRESPLSPIMNLKVNLSNKDQTFSITDTTDAAGWYDFENLPNDDYYLLFLDEEDEQIIEDSTYIFKGRVTMKGLPYTKALINGLPTDDDGKYRIEMKNQFYGLLSRESSKLDEMTLEDVMAKYGDQSAPGLSFRVQVAAYVNAGNYSSKHLVGLGSIDKIILDDSITRFTMGEFTTLRAARALQDKAIAKGQEDAFVIMMLNGKRTYLEELINTEVFK
ncbi:MAG: PD40 domain-containing protein [Flavobacteriales bacterium]|nr:PD40 domain-containing protein [Flavobacteriales bacterium]